MTHFIGDTRETAFGVLYLLLLVLDFGLMCGVFTAVVPPLF